MRQYELEEEGHGLFNELHLTQTLKSSCDHECVIFHSLGLRNLIASFTPGRKPSDRSCQDPKPKHIDFVWQARPLAARHLTPSYQSIRRYLTSGTAFATSSTVDVMRLFGKIPIFCLPSFLLGPCRPFSTYFFLYLIRITFQ